MTPALETSRLLLRPLEIADADEVQILFPKWEIVRYLANHVPWPYPSDGAYMFYHDAALPAMDRGEEWHWTLRLKSDPGRLIGSISLRAGPENNRGFWLGLPWQGRRFHGKLHGDSRRAARAEVLDKTAEHPFGLDELETEGAAQGQVVASCSM